MSRNRFYTLTSAFSISHDNIDTVEGKVFEYIFSVNSICHTLMILPNTSTGQTYLIVFLTESVEKDRSASFTYVKFSVYLVSFF